MYDKKKIVEVRSQVTPFPAECMSIGCKNKTTVVFMKVFNKMRNKVEMGCTGAHTGKYAYTHGLNHEVTMTDQYKFISWLTRCGECYLIDLEKHGKRATDNCRRHAENIKNSNLKIEEGKLK